MNEGVLRDLFGNVIPARRGRGRPAHEVTAENRQKVLLWFAAGYSDDDVSEALGITSKTLNKYYFHELAIKRTARMQLDIKNLRAIIDQVDKGNAAAMSLLDKKIERWRIGVVGKPGRPPKPPKLGKKEQQLIDAINVGTDPEWDSLLTVQ